VAASRSERPPDPLGKRALFWVPAAAGETDEEPEAGRAATTTALPVGKRVLYSGARPEPDSWAATSGNPLVGRGSFIVECERCQQTSFVGVLDLLIYQLPIGVWLPRGRFDRHMTCPACRKRSWCSVSLRRR
jgi:hypothetical protein